MTFEDYLADVFSKRYHGNKDQWEADFENWICDLEVDEVIELGNKYGKELEERLKTNLFI